VVLGGYVSVLERLVVSTALLVVVIISILIVKCHVSKNIKKILKFDSGYKPKINIFKVLHGWLGFARIHQRLDLPTGQRAIRIDLSESIIKARGSSQWSFVVLEQTRVVQLVRAFELDLEIRVHFFL
jgi:hypothetical protein